MKTARLFGAPKVNSKSFDNSHARGAVTLVASLVVVAGLLILPAMALHRRGLDLRWAGAYGLVVSMFSYWAYAEQAPRPARRMENIRSAVAPLGITLADGQAHGSRSGGASAQMFQKAATSLCSGSSCLAISSPRLIPCMTGNFPAQA